MSRLICCFLGDILLTDSLFNNYMKNNNVIINRDVINYINDSDIITGNYEFAIIKERKPYHIFSREQFFSKPHHLEIIKNINWTFFSISNNHISDWGYENILFTKEILKNISEYEPIGAGKDQFEAIKPLILERKNKKVAFFGISEKRINNATKTKFGSAPINYKLIKKVIDEFKGKTKTIISLIHWGTEYIPYPSPEQRKISEKLSKMGISLIIGTHPHILQGYEKLKNTNIFYSLGNFVGDLSIDCNPADFAFDLSRYSIILKVIINERDELIFEKKFIEINQENSIVSFVDEKKVKELENWFNQISYKTQKSKAYYYSSLLDVLGNREMNAILLRKDNIKIKLKKLLFYLRFRYLKKIFLYFYYKYIKKINSDY